MEKKSKLLNFLMDECQNQKNDVYFAQQVAEEMKLVLKTNKNVYLQNDFNEDSCPYEDLIQWNHKWPESLIKKEWYRI